MYIFIYYFYVKINNKDNQKSIKFGEEVIYDSCKN